MSDAKTKITAAMRALDLTVKADFIPFSQSRNAANDPDGREPGKRSLNWKVTILRGERPILTTDYSAGIGHCPSYKQSARRKVDYHAAINFETEKGCRAPRSHSMPIGGAPILPEAESVIWSLIQDASVLDAGGFEGWAADYDYDTDSRSAEAAYRACLDLALKLRGALGDAGIEALRVAGEDF